MEGIFEFVHTTLLYGRILDLRRNGTYGTLSEGKKLLVKHNNIADRRETAKKSNYYSGSPSKYYSVIFFVWGGCF